MNDTQVGLAKKWESFTGRVSNGVIGHEDIELPNELMFVGLIPAIEYLAPRDMGDGEWSLFRHEFEPADAPALCVSPDMRQLWFVGGGYRFTSRGIVDDSDSRHKNVV